MINGVYIILSSGVMVYSKSFEDQSLFHDKQFLISGLLSAITSIAQEALRDILKEIILQNQKIIFKSTEHYFVALITRLDIESTFLKKVLEQIVEKFNENYDVSEFNGKLTGFYNFTPILDEIIEENKTTYMKLHEKYEKIFNKELNISV